MSDSHSDDHSGNKIYYTVFYTLIALTALTVFSSRQDFGNHAINIVIAVVIAMSKATVVALFFMHLKYDGKLDKWLYVTATFPLILFMILTILLIPDVGMRDHGREFEKKTEAGEHH